MKAIIFDFDGTIIDTETPDYVSWRAVFADYGCELSFDLWADSIGRTTATFNIYHYLQEMSGQFIDSNVIHPQRLRHYLKLVAKEPIRPGVQATMDEAKRLGLGLGVSSSGTRNWVEGHLRQRGMLPRFAAISTTEDVVHGKPAPDLFLRTARLLEVAPAQAIAIEDSPHGVAAARAAGMFTVAVPNPTTQSLDFDSAHLRLNSLADMNLADMIHLATIA